MPTTSKILEGISIINSYYAQDGYNLEAEHDQIFMAPTDQPIPFFHLQKLVDMGWFQDGLDEDSISHSYNVEEPWQLYV